MRSRTLRLGLALCLLVVCGIAATPLVLKVGRLRAQRQWKDNAIAEIRGLAADQTWVAARMPEIRQRIARGEPDGPWVGDRLALMANGDWIIFQNNCEKKRWQIGDQFIALASNGKWYHSSYHFCIDMISAKIEPQPRDLADFATTFYLREFDGKSDEAIKSTWPK